jgi:hypothetical protein
MKNIIEVNGYTLKKDIEEMCWKKAGFKDYRALMNAVRDLPLEERVNMLTELFLTDLAKMHVRNRTEFIEELGGHPGIKREEIVEWAKGVFKETETTEWRFEIDCDYYVDPSRLTVEWYNKEARAEWLKEERRKRI